MLSLDQWKSQGHYHQVGGHRLFVQTRGEGKPYLMVLHGYPTCSYDYHQVLEPLSEHYHVVLHDHLGFGLSDKPTDYSYSLMEQTDMALALWQQLGIKKAHIFAHDYGTSIATEILARKNFGWEPIEICSMTLSNGSMHIELAKLRPIQKLLLHPSIGPLIAQWSTKGIFYRNMRKIWADPTKVDTEELAVLWEMLLYNNGRTVLPALTQYIQERKRFWHRWIGALQQTKVPINILWATEDPVAVKEMAVVLAEEISHNRLVWLKNTGHYPMLESSAAWQRKLLELLAL
ncbi:MAG: alpha/beta fold hydrolase [Saprospiraceae bacterium]